MKHKVLVSALKEFFKSPEGHLLITQALNESMSREIRFEKNRDEETSLPISPPKIMVKKTNVIDELLIYLSRMEGAFQGLQNKMVELDIENKKLIGSYQQQLAVFGKMMSQLQIENKKELKVLDTKG